MNELLAMSPSAFSSSHEFESRRTTIAWALVLWNASVVLVTWCCGAHGCFSPSDVLTYV